VLNLDFSSINGSDSLSVYLEVLYNILLNTLTVKVKRKTLIEDKSLRLKEIRYKFNIDC